MKLISFNKTKSGLRTLLAGLFLVGTFVASAQCNANFTYTIGSNGSVSFLSTSTNTTPSAWLTWNINGVPAFGPSATHVFTSNGPKSVCLTVNDTAANCTSIKCDSVFITNANPAPPCNANFSYVLGANGSVNFASTSTGTSISTNYSWSFGSGWFGSGTTPSHAYTSNGPKVVCLTITNSVTSCTSTKCYTVTITNITPSTTPCNANFTRAYGANGAVSFVSTSTGTSSTTHYSWNFGGSYAVGSTAAHTYTSNGMKWVCLTITDSLNNCSNTQCDSLFITNAGSVTCAPSVVYTLSKDSSLALTWNAYPFYPSNITNATWSWGDGSITVGLYPTHTYSAAGTYSTCVTVSVSCGTVTATYCYVAAIFRSSENNDMITVNVKQGLSTGIRNEAKAESRLNIYPNPNNGEFILELQGGGNNLENTVLIYNMLGEKVLETQVSASDKQTIDVSNLANGTYLVRINSDAGSLHKKITIQK